ncbi:class I SAM-dependent methyltransferase [Kytococcus sedentarius]|uniref:class I SAM-dependent methyltransferase n=1 Tax=Kytococcus sedentarius TaxID=1276 RepID=UPI0035BC16F2
MADHYFSATPASPDERRELTVDLAGHRCAVVTAPGVFSAEHLDHATAFLLDAVPVPAELVARGAGVQLLDIGCGWGPVALSLALQAPEAAVWAVEVNERAADLARENARRLGVLAAGPGAPGVHVVAPEHVPDEVRFDGIWSNPPIRVGKQALHEILARWLPRLRGEGAAWLVVGKNLGAPSLQRWITEFSPDASSSDLQVDSFTCERTARHKGFWVLEARPA